MPKSGVLFIISALTGLFVAAPIMFFGIHFEIGFIEEIGTILFWLCWAVGLFFWFILMTGKLFGRHKNIKEQDWDKQVW